MVSIDRQAKQLFRSFQASFGSFMRGRLASERQVRAKKIKTIKATIKAIDAAIRKPDSKPALRRLRAVKIQMEIGRASCREKVTKRVDTSKRKIARLHSRL